MNWNTSHCIHKYTKLHCVFVKLYKDHCWSNKFQISLWCLIGAPMSDERKCGNQTFSSRAVWCYGEKASSVAVWLEVSSCVCPWTVLFISTSQVQLMWGEAGWLEESGFLFSFPKTGYSLINPIHLASRKINPPKCRPWQEQTALAGIKNSISAPSTKAWSVFSSAFTVKTLWWCWK